MSPLYGFSADDAARLRAGDKKVSLYASLTKAAAGGGPPVPAGAPGPGPAAGTWPPPCPRTPFLTQLYGRHRLPRHGPGHGGRRGPPGQPPAAPAVRRGVRGLRLQRHLRLPAVSRAPAPEQLRPAGRGGPAPGGGRGGRDEHPQVQGPGIPRVRRGRLRPQLCLRPAGGRAPPPGAGPGGQAPGREALRPVHHHRAGGHRPGDRPQRRGGGAAGAVRGHDPGQGEADPGGLRGRHGPHPGKTGHGAHGGAACPPTRCARGKTPPNGCCSAPCATRTGENCGNWPGWRTCPCAGRTTPPGASAGAGTNPPRRRNSPRRASPPPWTWPCISGCAVRWTSPTPTAALWGCPPRWRPPSWRQPRGPAGRSPCPGPPGWESRA